MSTLHPPSTSPSPSPAPGSVNGGAGRAATARASMGPSARIVSGAGAGPAQAAPSPRPGGAGGARPTSELLGGSGMFQTPEAEAIDQWFENLQNYETTLEEMAAASLDVNFKEELSAIEQWFRVLSEAERTAALYSLIQHSTQVQIRFFITLLQQMARSDPMTALLSPAVGSSMQTQMEAKLASMGLKSPGLKSPNSPSRNFAQRQSLAVEPTSNSFLSPDSANVPPSPGGNNQGSNTDAAATLAQQRAKLKANAAHRISAPGTLAGDARSVWQTGASALGQVVEGGFSPTGDSESLRVLSPGSGLGSGARPKSTDFSGVANSFRNVRGEENLGEQLSPMVGGNWASMVNTPLVPMFNQENAQNGNAQNMDAVAARLANWSLSNNNGGKVQLDDPRKFRRASRGATGNPTGNTGGGGSVLDIYGDDGNLLVPGGAQPGQGARNNGGGGNGGLRSVSGGSNASGASLLGQQQQQQGWVGARSPGGFSNVSSGRFGSDDGRNSNVGGGGGGGNGGFGLGNGMQSPTAAQVAAAQAAMGLGMNPMPGFGGLNGLNMNMLNAMGGFNMAAAAGLHPDAQQLLSAQIAAAAAFNPALNGFGLQPGGVGMRNNMRGSGGRSPGGNKSNSGRDGGGGGSGGSGKEKDEEVDPALLNDIPAWLRSLRLHKYTPNFEGMGWRDMVVMDEAALEAQGVAALGARRKMLKTFEAVRNKMGIDGPGSAGPGSSNAGSPGPGSA